MFIIPAWSLLVSKIMFTCFLGRSSDFHSLEITKQINKWINKEINVLSWFGFMAYQKSLFSNAKSCLYIYI